MTRLGSRRLTTLVAVAIPAMLVLTCQSAWATTATQEISSAGPLTSIYVGNDLDCQVQYAGQADGAFYPAASVNGSTPTGDCGTFVSVGAEVYGPDFSTNYATGTGISLTTADNYATYTPGNQSTVTGAGTSGSPYAVTTSATAGTAGITVSETDRYVAGGNGYQTNITLTNTSAAGVTGVLYHAVDCYAAGSDNGYGEEETDGAIVCATSADNTAGGPAEELEPLTAGSHFVETYFNTLWADIDDQTDLPDTCDCTIHEDDAAGVNWDFSLVPGGSATYALRTNFAATGTAGSPTGGGTTSGAGGGTTTGPGSGTGAGSGTGHGNETGHGKVRITLRQLAGHHHSRASMSLPAGFTGERVRATLHGAGVRAATGTVTYDLYRGRLCRASHRVLRGGRKDLRHGRVPASRKVTRALHPGRYSWQAVYSGDADLQRTKSTCGIAVLSIKK
jgi:hypothetical protein